MKKIAIVLALISLVLFVGCVSTGVEGSGVKGKAPKVSDRERILVDYQGATLGKEVPEWVALLVQGQYSQPVLSTVMPSLENKKVFVTTGRGDNLDFVKTWADLVDIETEVAATLERVAGKAVDASMKGSSSAEGKEVDPSEVEKNITMYRTALSSVRFSGLERVASYWIETEVYEKDTLIDDYFEYYSVWTMDQALYDAQLEEAMSHIDETTTEAQNLKKMVKSKLNDTLGISNDDEMNDNLDSKILNAVTDVASYIFK